MTFRGMLSFFNHLGLDCDFIELLETTVHPCLHFPEWKGIGRYLLKTSTEEQWEFDIRYAFSHEVLKQHLVDHGWNATNLIYSSQSSKTIRHKGILYLYDSPHSSPFPDKWQSLPNSAFPSGYWRSIQHRYLSLPSNLPFALPSLMPASKELFSTTQSFHSTPPIFEHLSEAQFLPRLQGAVSKSTREGGLRSKNRFKQTMEGKPLISIITVTLNTGPELEQTIQSVINQNYSNVEYLIIDGGSTDETMEILTKYEEQIDYWISEADGGLYDAMNKGIQLASGVLIGLLNAGDFYLQGSLKHLAQVYGHSLHKADVYYGSTHLKYHHFDHTLVSSPSVEELHYGMSLFHQSLFIARSTYQRYGLYNLRFKFAADYHLLLHLLQSKAVFQDLQYSVALFRDGGVSDQKLFASRMECIQIHREAKTQNLFPILRFYGKQILLHYTYKFLKWGLGPSTAAWIRKQRLIKRKI